MTDYGDSTPWGTEQMFKVRTTLMGKDTSAPVAREYLITAHAEVVQMLLDGHGIDPSSITSSTSGYTRLQRAETDIAAGLWEEDTDLDREIERAPGRPYRSVRYYRGIDAIVAWATHYNETSSPNSRVSRNPSRVSNRRDYRTSHYG